MSEHDYLFSVRTAAILAIALDVALGAAWLTYAMEQPWPAVVMAGAAGFWGAMVGLHAIVGP